MKERSAFALPGIVVIIGALALVGIVLQVFPRWVPLLAVPGAVLGVILLKGMLILPPNEARVLTFFGNYTGTLARNGFW